MRSPASSPQSYMQCFIVSDLHSSYRLVSKLDSESAWRSWTQRLPSLFPPYSLCTSARNKHIDKHTDVNNVSKLISESNNSVRVTEDT